MKNALMRGLIIACRVACFCLVSKQVWEGPCLIVSVIGNVSRVSDGSGKPKCDVHKHHKPHKKIDVMKDIDAVPSNIQSARQDLLYVFEDNEAVIKMIIKGRSLTMRHVSCEEYTSKYRKLATETLRPKLLQ